MKASAIANSNIAFVKYWGKLNPNLFIPTRSNLSMTVDALNTHTTVEFSKGYDKDIVYIDGKLQEGESLSKVVRFLDVIRKYAKNNLKAKVFSINNFPKGAGLASSASGFAALTVAACAALGLELDDKQLSILSRQGSGSSCRSIKGGFVKWVAGKTSEESYAYQLYDENYWDIRDIVAIVRTEEKKVSSRAGMETSVKTCPLYNDFVKVADLNVREIEKSFMEKDFEKLGRIIELESFLLHAVMMTTKPPLVYWSPDTIRIIHEVQSWRDEGVKTYQTIDAGSNVHVITLPEDAAEVEKRLKKIQGVINIIHNRPGGDAKPINKHLF